MAMGFGDYQIQPWIKVLVLILSIKPREIDSCSLFVNNLFYDRHMRGYIGLDEAYYWPILDREFD